MSPGSGVPLIVRLSRLATPPRALVLSFALLILIGWGVLLLPGFTAKPLSPIDALFTSTSAVCVTGLIVVDTGSHFTVAGQWAILILIQFGGLGIMTFSVLLYRLVTGKGYLGYEIVVRDSFSYRPQHNTMDMVRFVVALTFGVELVGAILLLVFFSADYSAPRAAFLAVFHSVSAFCNAGFSLWPDSLTRYAGHTGINLVFMALIILGGLGFIVISDLGRLIRPGRRSRLTLHSRLALTTTAALIVFGAALFAHQEWTNVLRGMSWCDKIIVSLFQSITPRTAGFNSVDYYHLTNTSLLMTIILMFVGGCPGSTAGGIKTMTLAVLVALAVSRFRGFNRATAFRRSVPNEIVARGLTITLIGISVVIIALVFLLATETGHLDHSQTRDVFLDLLFEVVSAFGTVGLSMGATANLTVWGKVIIIFTMFLGRVGPLTVAMALVAGRGRGRSYRYAREEVMVG